MAKWVNARPVGSDPAEQVDNTIQENNGVLQEALDEDHEFVNNDNTQQSLKHKKITFQEQSGDQTTAADELGLYAKDDGGSPALYFRPESDGTVKKLVSNAGLLVTENSDMKDEDLMGSDSDTHAATQQSIKAYIDAQIALQLALAGGTMSGNIAMGGQKLTGLAAGSDAGHSIRYEQITGSNSLEWSGGVAEVQNYGAYERHYARYSNTREDGTDGGSITASVAWAALAINTEDVDADSFAVAPSSNQMELAAGTYDFQATAVFYDCGDVRARLQNVTTPATLGSSPNGWAHNSQNTGAIMTFSGRFTIAASQKIELQYWADNTKNTHGQGRAVNSGESEVYHQVNFWKAIA